MNLNLKSDKAEVPIDEKDFAAAGCLENSDTEKEMQAALRRARERAADYSNKQEKAAKLMEQPGHPLQTLARENEALSKLLKNVKQSLASGGSPDDARQEIGDLSIHYAKKGDLLYPLLKVKYGISGPSDVMWTEDDEIRDELAAVMKSAERDMAWRERVKAVLTRADEMIRKENKILFPNCAVNFSEDDWKEIYRDTKDYADCFGVQSEIWPEAENEEPARPGIDGEIVLPGGHLSFEQLTALLNTIPMEITFVDDQNINRFFNEGPKVFKRPGMALDRDVFSCHPPKIEAMVRRILEDFRSGRRDKIPLWMDKGGKPMLVTYMAVRDRAGNYLGTMELVQDMEEIQRHFLSEQ